MALSSPTKEANAGDVVARDSSSDVQVTRSDSGAGISPALENVRFEVRSGTHSSNHFPQQVKEDG